MSFWLIYEFANNWFGYLLFFNTIPLCLIFAGVFYFIVENPIFLLKRKEDLAAAQLSLEKISKSKHN